MTFPRPLSEEERNLVQWMLMHGEPEAEGFINQLEDAVVSGMCGCGCASIDFKIRDRHTDMKKGMTILSDYLYGSDEQPFGAIVFAHGDTLGGLEVYGFDDTPAWLPKPEQLRELPKNRSEQDAVE